MRGKTEAWSELQREIERLGVGALGDLTGLNKRSESVGSLLYKEHRNGRMRGAINEGVG